MIRPRALLLTLTLAAATGALGYAWQAPATKGETIVLKGAMIKTQTDAGDFIGTIVISDGKITAIGPNVTPPAGAKVQDVTGCTITPGLIDAYSILGLNRAAAGEGGREANLNITDAVDPYSEDWLAAARQGITATYSQPAASGSLGGSGAVIGVCGPDCVDKRTVRGQAAVQAALGTAPRAEAPQSSALEEFLRGRGIQLPTTPQPAAAPPVSNSLTRFAQYEQLRTQFEAAKRYGESKPARPDHAKELLLKATKGEIPVCIDVHHEDDVRNALKLATTFGLRPLFTHVERAKPIPEELRTARSNLILGPFLGGTPSEDVRKLALDGRRFAIGTFSDDPRGTCGLRYHAAAAVAAGYPREKVLRALTADAADLFGAGDKLGKLAANRPADLVVFAGDPLDPAAPVRLTISQGRVTHSAPNAEIAPSALAAQPDLPAKFPASYVIKTKRLLNSSGAFAPGELHVVDGVLTAASSPNGASSAPVFDVGDAPITPGFVAAHVTSPGQADPDADAAHLRAADGLSADDSRVRACRNGGFLTVVVAPASNNVIAGIASTVRPTETPLPVESSLKFVLTAAARNRERYPASLAGQIELIDSRLRGNGQETSTYLHPALRAGIFAERERAAYAVRNRQLTAAFEAQTRAEILGALRIINEHGIRGALINPRDVDELVADIRQANVPVILGPVRPQDSDKVVKGLVELTNVGVPVAFGGDAADLRASAACLVNAGLPRQVARRALMAQPAPAFGLPQSSARLQAGDAADFVVWSNDPLDLSGRPRAVVVAGQRVAKEEGGADKPTVATQGPATAPTRRGRGR